MSFDNTTISKDTRYAIYHGANSTWFAATSGEFNSAVDPADVTDSESVGKRRRKAGVYEAELTIRGNVASDVSPHSAPLLIIEGGIIDRIDIYMNGSANPADTFTNVFVDRWRRTSGPNLSEPNHFELHGFAPNYTPGG